MRITRIAVLSLLLLPLLAAAPAVAAEPEALPALQNQTPATAPSVEVGVPEPFDMTRYCYWEGSCHICEVSSPGGLFCIQRICPTGDSEDCWYT